MSYCAFCRSGKADEFNRRYHDTEYGFPAASDDALFERLVLEINQAGLSWLTILKKRADFRAAYHDFSIEAVAAYTDEDIGRLLSHPGIIRNRLKVYATIENARRIQKIQHERGSFRAWLNQHYPRSPEDWAKLFKKTFQFTGGEITREFLLSTGYLPGAHDAGCPAGAAAERARHAR